MQAGTGVDSSASRKSRMTAAISFALSFKREVVRVEEMDHRTGNVAFERFGRKKRSWSAACECRNLILRNILAGCGRTLRVIYYGAFFCCSEWYRPRKWRCVAVTFLVSAITLGTGRTYLMQGAVHLLLFAAYLFLAFVPWPLSMPRHQIRLQKMGLLPIAIISGAPVNGDNPSPMPIILAAMVIPIVMPPRNNTRSKFHGNSNPTPAPEGNRLGQTAVPTPGRTDVS